MKAAPQCGVEIYPLVQLAEGGLRAKSRTVELGKFRAPVLAPRMKQELEPGMVFALEPKIVLPGIGPVGIENSWAVTTDGLEKLTLCKEEIIEL